MPTYCSSIDHWLRTCWVSNMWSQATQNQLTLIDFTRLCLESSETQQSCARVFCDMLQDSRQIGPKTQQPHRRHKSNDQSPGRGLCCNKTRKSPLASAELAPVSEGVYIGDGLPPVPTKLAAKIRKGELVEMGELLPEFWSSHREDIEGKHDVKVRRSRKVADIFTWLQCFGSYISVRAQHTPGLAPELMAYMAAIVRVSQDYAELAWV